jgi:organic hydroperoxide reductase OsmC/OhrA
MKLPLQSSQTTATVGLVKGENGYRLVVTIAVSMQGVSPDQTRQIAEAAHQTYPASNVLRGNVDVTLIVQ